MTLSRFRRHRLAIAGVSLAALLAVPVAVDADSGRDRSGSKADEAKEAKEAKGGPKADASTTLAPAVTTIEIPAEPSTSAVATTEPPPAVSLVGRAKDIARFLGDLATMLEKAKIAPEVRDGLLPRVRAMRDAVAAGLLPTQADMQALSAEVLAAVGRSSGKGSPSNSVASTSTLPETTAPTTSVPPSPASPVPTSGSPTGQSVPATVPAQPAASTAEGSAPGSTSSPDGVAPDTESGRPGGRAALDAAISAVTDSPLPDSVKQDILDVLGQAKAIIENGSSTPGEVAEQLRRLHDAQQAERLATAVTKLIAFSQKIAVLAFDSGTLPGAGEMVVQVHDKLSQANILLSSASPDIATVKTAWKLLHEARTIIQQFLDATP